jgi:hypothetical protein
MLWNNHNDCCGFDFRKVLLPIPVSAPVPVPDSTVFQKQKISQNLAFSMSKTADIPESWHLILKKEIFSAPQHSTVLYRRYLTSPKTSSNCSNQVFLYVCLLTEESGARSGSVDTSNDGSGSRMPKNLPTVQDPEH